MAFWVIRWFFLFFLISCQRWGFEKYRSLGCTNVVLRISMTSRGRDRGRNSLNGIWSEVLEDSLGRNGKREFP